MSEFEAVILGIIQGFIEFLPISSTGHLTLTGNLLNLIDSASPEKWTAFIAVIQLGTLAAILAYFWRDLLNITVDFIKENLGERRNFSKQGFNSKLGWYIIIGTVPVVIIGLGFKDFIEGAFTKNLIVIASSLIVLGIILAFAEKVGKFQKELTDLKCHDALWIGLGQWLAPSPGSSRSGTTISAGLFLGLKRETAARFSFLLSVPAILGSGLLQFYQALEYIDYSGLVNLIIATMFSAISGYFTIEFLLKYLRKHNTFIFVFYRIIVGIIIFILINLNTINP